jgi:lysozyme
LPFGLLIDLCAISNGCSLFDLCALIRRFEGLKLSAYYCPAGVATIGYGHTGSDVTLASSPISMIKAEALLKPRCTLLPCSIYQTFPYPVTSS